jgi:hypothetical protein
MSLCLTQPAPVMPLRSAIAASPRKTSALDPPRLTGSYHSLFFLFRSLVGHVNVNVSLTREGSTAQGKQSRCTSAQDRDNPKENEAGRDADCAVNVPVSIECTGTLKTFPRACPIVRVSMRKISHSPLAGPLRDQSVPRLPKDCPPFLKSFSLAKGLGDVLLT